jgi:hypothetical protein
MPAENTPSLPVKTIARHASSSRAAVNAAVSSSINARLIALTGGRSIAITRTSPSASIRTIIGSPL